MTDLTTRTPVEIDTELSALYQAEFGLEAKVDGALLAVRRGLGHRPEVTGRGAGRREEWPTDGDTAVSAMRALGDILIGMMRPASDIVAKYDAAVAELAANRAAQAPLHAEYARRPWIRFYYVNGGHVHRTMRCSTCNNGRQRTRFEWLLEWSGRNEDEAVAALAAAAHTLCSQPCCFPGAPVAAQPARKTAGELAADKAAAARTARTEDPKLIADTDGGELVVDGDRIRTVRTAEIKATDHLWWAAYQLHNSTAGASASRYEQHAAKIAAALAHKRGTTAAAELAALVVKATKKVRRDLSADTATAAAARWTAQAEAAAVPAPMTAQPQPQHAGRDGDQPQPGRAYVQQGDGPGREVQIRQAVNVGAYVAGAAAAAAGHEVLAVRMRLAAIGQVTRELTGDQVAELGRRIAAARPVPAGEQLHPFLAARLAATENTGVRRCCTMDSTDADCEAVHPGFTTPTAALAALAAELEAEATDPAAYLAAHLGGMDDDARTAAAAAARADGEETGICRYDGAAIFRNRYTIARAESRREGVGWRDDRFDETGRCLAGEHGPGAPGTPVFHEPRLPAGATWATWDGHGRPADAILHGISGMTFRPEPVTIALDEQGRVVARSVGGRYVNTAIATAELLLAVPSPDGDEAACRFCGCTMDRACLGGCAWGSDGQIRAAGLEPMDGDVCTACLPAPVSRQQAHLERDQDEDDEGDEARDCVRVSVHTDGNGDRWQWCATHRRHELIGGAGEDLDAAAAEDPGLAEVLAIAAAAPTIQVTDPAGLLDLVRQYAAEWHRFLAITPETADIDDADRAEAAAAGTLSRIAEALGVAGDSPAAAVPAPRLGDGPPAG